MQLQLPPAGPQVRPGRATPVPTPVPPPVPAFREGQTPKNGICPFRITQDLPQRSPGLSPAEQFRIFVTAVFYVGKGTRDRPWWHLRQALAQHRRGTHRVGLGLGLGMGLGLGIGDWNWDWDWDWNWDGRAQPVRVESSAPRWASLGRCVMPSTAMKKKVRTGRRILGFPSPSPSMNAVCCIHPSGWGCSASEASRSQRCILFWKCQALKPGLILVWVWAGFVLSLPRRLLLSGRCWGCCKTLCKAPCKVPAQGGGSAPTLPCPRDTFPRCPRSPEFAQGSREDEI